MRVSQRLAALPLRTVLRRLLTPGIIVVTVVLLGAVVFSSSIALQVPKDNLSVIRTLVPLADLQRALQLHRGLASQYLNGNTAVETRITNVERSCDSLLQRVRQHVGETPVLAEVAEVAALVEELATRWQQLRAEWREHSAFESFEIHSNLVEATLELENVLLHQAKFDPAMSSLILLLYRRLPQLTEALGQLRGLGSGYLARDIDTLRPDEREQLKQLVQAARLQQQRIEQVVKSQFHQTRVSDLLSSLQQLLPQARQLLQDIERTFVESSTIAGDPQRFFQQATRVIDQFYRWGDTATAYIVADIEGEYSWSVATVYSALGVSLVLVLILVMISLMTGKTVVTNIAALVEAFRSLQEDEVRKEELEVVAHLRNEVGELARSIVEVGERLTKRLKTLRWLDRIAGEASSGRSLEQLGNTIVAGATDIVNGSGATFVLLDDQGQPQFRFQSDGQHQETSLALQSVGSGSRRGDTIEVTLEANQKQIGSLVVTSGDRLFGEDDRYILEAFADILGGIVGAYLMQQELSKFNQQLLEDAELIGVVLHEMARGNLSAVVQVSGKESAVIQRLQGDIQSLLKSWNALIGKLRTTAEHVASAAAQMGATTEQLATAAQEQSAQSAQIAAAVEQMSHTIADTSRNVHQVGEASRQAAAVAGSGKDVLQEVLGQMQAIAGQVQKAVEQLGTLQQAAERIQTITAVITEIADQTNLLALNAAIEAARAGDAGRGFAVVADEVRKLAERTGESAKEIADIIQQLQQSTADTVSAMEEVQNTVDEGVGRTTRAQQALEEIVKSSETVEQMLSQIVAAVEQESATSEEMSRNITAMSQVIEESAKGIAELAEAARNLSQLADDLQQSLRVFQLAEQTTTNKALPS